MIKSSSVICLLTFLTLGVSAQGKFKHTDLETFKLNGKVKTLVETRWQITGSKTSDTTTCTINFNEAGYITDKITISPKGAKSFEKYDGKGHMLEYTGTSGTKEVHQYDAKGNEIQSDDMDPTSGNKTLFKYDTSNNMIEQKFYNHKGVLTSTEKYKNDVKGNRIEYNYYEGGLVTDKQTYKYDDKGNKIETDDFEKGILFDKTYFKYNDMGLQISSKEYSAHGKLKTDDSTAYDIHGNETYNRTIDPEGLGNDPSMKYYTYQYDDKGNWITQLSEQEMSALRFATDGAARKIIDY